MPASKHHFSYLYLVIILNLAFLWGAGATTVMPMDLRKLTGSAQSVVYGKVIEIENLNGSRRATVDVMEHIRGESTGSPLKVELLQKGSREAGWVERVPDAVELKSGEEIVLFLRRSTKSQNWLPVGLQQGKYRVVADRRGVRRALSWRDAAINSVSDAELLDSSRTASMISGRIAGLSNAELEQIDTLSHLVSQVQGFAK